MDSLPHAIELAAARVGYLPVEDIARRLDLRFRWRNTHAVMIVNIFHFTK